MPSKEFCASHEKVMQFMGKYEGIAEEHTRQLRGVFKLLGETKEAVDQNLGRAEARDDALAGLKETIEGKLSTDISNTMEIVKNLTTCLDRGKREREEAAKNGFGGYIKRGFEEFKSKSAYIFITAGIVGGVWFAIWVLAKIKIFHESPLELLKFFGIG